MVYKRDLSIIIPVYNTEKYIEKCLDSVVVATSGLNAEALIINDGTPDKAGCIAQAYEEKYPQLFRYFEKENGGLADVKNYGLKYAEGKYIIYLDSDDFVDPEMYREMFAAAVENDADCVVCDFFLDYEQTGELEYVPCLNKNRNGVYYQLIDNNMMAASWNKMIRRELYEGVDFPVGKNNEDVCVTPIVLGRAKNIQIIEKPLYHYVQRSGSIQNSKFSEKRFVLLDTAEIALKRGEELSEEAQSIMKNSIYLHQIFALAFYLIRRESFFTRWRLLRKYMTQIGRKFPDLFVSSEIQEFTTWGSRGDRALRTVSVNLLKRKMYFLCCVLWSVAGPVKKIRDYIKRQA